MDIKTTLKYISLFILFFLHEKKEIINNNEKKYKAFILNNLTVRFLKK